VPGLLLVAIDLPDGLAGELHRWYDTEHVPERLAVAGIGPVTRWNLVSGNLPRFLALFELGSADVLDSGAYASLKAAGDTPWTARLRSRFDTVVRLTLHEVADYGGQPGTATACAVAITDVDPVEEQTYRRWYDDHHGPQVAGVTGVVRARRFERDGDVPRHVTVIELASPAVLSGAAYTAAKATTPDGGLRDRWRRSQGVFEVLEAYREAAVTRDGGSER